MTYYDFTDSVLTGGNVGAISLLRGDSVAASQEPSGLDAPIQVEFGPAQNGPSDPVEIDALGNITFNTAGSYFSLITFQFGRLGASGTSILLGRALINGVQVGNTVSVRIDSSNQSAVVQFDLELVGIPSGAVLTLEIARDSGGSDFGGLFRTVPTTLAWNDAPSARIEVFNLKNI